MSIIVPGIHSIAQHISTLQQRPEVYRPDRCPCCGKNGLWAHGSYERKVNRRGLSRAERSPVAIPRFLCPHCGTTCSTLPQVIPPRRWYLWSTQQAVLALLIGALSLSKLAKLLMPSVWTLKRWWTRFQQRLAADSFHLRSRFAHWGRCTGFDDFWRTCLSEQPLSRLMFWLHQAECVIP